MRVHLIDRLRQNLKGFGVVVQRPKLSAAYLRRYQLPVGTLVDIGVHAGTPSLYAAFPHVPLVLIDPLGVPAELVRRLESQGRDVTVHETALASEEGSAELFVHAKSSRSSLLERSALTQQTVAERRTVPKRPLDTVLGGGDHPEPYGVKIDTEGYELEVLRGAAATLERTSFILSEVSVKRRFEGGYRFSELVGLLAEHGFELYDTLNQPAGSPRYLDCLFLPRTSPLFDRD
jgi:FkbM family methyltransferase